MQAQCDTVITKEMSKQEVEETVASSDNKPFLKPNPEKQWTGCYNQCRVVNLLTEERERAKRNGIKSQVCGVVTRRE